MIIPTPSMEIIGIVGFGDGLDDLVGHHSPYSNPRATAISQQFVDSIKLWLYQNNFDMFGARFFIKSGGEFNLIKVYWMLGEGPSAIIFSIDFYPNGDVFRMAGTKTEVKSEFETSEEEFYKIYETIVNALIIG